MRVGVLWGLLLGVVVGLPPNIAAQLPDTTGLDATRIERLAGLYELEDGRLAYAMDLRDQLQGRPTLSLIEYGSGRTRALYPLESGAFEAGDRWFGRGAVEYTVRFDEAGGSTDGLTWTEEGRDYRGRRVTFDERAVTVSSGSVELAGSFVRRPGSDRLPAVIIVPGSGPTTRRSMRYMGDLFAYHGFLVLTVDKRGVGGSTGNWNGLGHADWANDLEAQLDSLLAQPDVDPGRVGFFAASEGGFVAPVVAARRPEVSFLACRVCSALPHRPVIVDMETGAMERRGLSREDAERGGELLDRMMGYALDRTGYDDLVAYAESGEGEPWRQAFPGAAIPAAGSGYWDNYRALLEADPAEHYPALDIPVLTILGERDDRILVDKHRDAFERMATNHPDFSVWVIEDATHGLLLNDERGTRGYPAGLHDRIVSWLQERVGR